MTSSETFYFNFCPSGIKQNRDALNDLMRFLSRSSVEEVERVFNITFSSGKKNGLPVYIYLGSEHEKEAPELDGKVDLSIPPFDHATKSPFNKEKLTFRVDNMFIRDELVRTRSYINSKLRNDFNL